MKVGNGTPKLPWNIYQAILNFWMFSFSYNYVFHSTPFFPNTNSERIRFKVLSKMVKEEMKMILLFFKYFCYNLLLKDMPVLKGYACTYIMLHKTFWGTTKKCENKNLN